MGLDLASAAHQIDTAARRLDDDRDDRDHRLALALRAFREAASSPDLLDKAASSHGRPFLCASLVEGLAGRHTPPKLPSDFCVASVDGSHIDVDRHMPVRCYLINVGGCMLTYGSHPDARLFSTPRLSTGEEELYMTSTAPGSRESVAVEGPILGLKRAVEEVRVLASLLEETPPDMPVLGLIDGSLVLWGLAGRGYQPFVREEVVGGGLIPAMDGLRKAAESRTLAVAAYVSLPQGTEVVNALRLQLCPNDSGRCRERCSGHRSHQAPCDTVNGFLDRHLFQELLAPGERSSLYFTNSSISRDFYGPHQVYFYYLNTGDEIARVEVPQWVALEGGLLSLSHALILDQCRRGRGYPVAISEAHEQAVLTGSDRQSFRQLLEEALDRRHLPVYTSEKARSKRTPWL